MSDSSPDPRMTELEIQLAHLQRQFDQLNEVVTDQAGKLDRLSRIIGKMSDSVEELKQKGTEERDPLDEKPPHY